MEIAVERVGVVPGQKSEIEWKIAYATAATFRAMTSVLLLAVAVGCSASNSPDIAAGLAAEGRNDHNEAIRLYSHALASGDLTHDGQAIVHFDRGIVFRKMGQTHRAIGDFDAALRLKPNFPEAYDERGIAKDIDGDADGAIADYDQAIRLKPDLADAYNNRGYALQQKRQYDKAILDYDAAIKLQPDNYRAYTNRGNSHQALGQYDKAIDDFSAVILHSPNNQAEAFDARGQAYKAAGRYDEAIADFNNALQLDPKYALAYAHRALAYHLKGQYESAIADYDRAIELKVADLNVYGNRGMTRFALGQYASAATDFEQSVKINSANAYWPLWLYLARAKAGASDADEFARNTAAIDRAKWPGPVVGLYLGQTAPEQVRAAAAEGEANGQRIRNCEAAFYSGEYEFLRRDLSAARSLLQQAVEICPADFVEYAGVGAELQRIGGGTNVSERQQPAQASVPVGTPVGTGVGKPLDLIGQPYQPLQQQQPPSKLAGNPAPAQGETQAPAPAPAPPAALPAAQSNSQPPLQMQPAAGDLSTTPAPVLLTASNPSAPPPMPIQASATPPQVASLSEEGAWHIQLGAARSSNEAEREWGRLQRTAPDVLGALTLRVQRADLGGSKGVFYRIQAGPFSDEAGAAYACTKLKGVQIDCLTVKP